MTWGVSLDRFSEGRPSYMSPSKHTLPDDGYVEDIFPDEPTIVSECCSAPVSAGTRKEYPTGGSTWSESYKIDVCDKCDKPCETVEEE